MIAFRVEGTPVPKARPRFTKFGRTYTPKRTKVYERLVAQHAQIAMVGKPKLEGALGLVVTAFMGMPVRWSIAKKNAAIRGEVAPAAKDLDNIVKAISDAMNGVVYADDRQIAEIRAAKKYSTGPCVTVSVFELRRG